MTNEIKSNYELDQYCQSIANDIFQELHDEDNLCSSRALDLAHEYADASEHVIYHYKSHCIMMHCTTCDGQDLMEQSHDGSFVDYDSLANQIVYFEICYRVEAKIAEGFEKIMQEPVSTTINVGEVA